jgi:acyl-CoA synthetase (NDP forming)
MPGLEAVREGADVALSPRSIAVIGASDSPDKIGGRPIKYLQMFGYRGRIDPINPNRDTIQGLKAYRELAATPDAPELAIVAVPGQAAVDAVAACAARGVKVAVVVASGFGEMGAEGKRIQDGMVATARAAGMRLIGPNVQGVANFATGAVFNFNTTFSETTPLDGPIAVVSQSGAMSALPYAHLRNAGLGVRYACSTGNESDLTVADFMLGVARDPEIRLMLLYLEAIADVARFEEAARFARARGLPIVALKAGVSPRGMQAATSHTGALATEDRTVDALFRQHGILRVADVRAFVNAAPLYLQGWHGRERALGRRIVAVSNSGASCVMAADAADRLGVPLGDFAPETRTELAKVLPEFGAAANPIDLTAALLNNNRMFGDLLGVLARHDAADAVYISLPASGAGYDLPRYVDDCSAWVRETGRPLVMANPLKASAQVFREGGIVVFDHEVAALEALAQLIHHDALLRKPQPQPAPAQAVALPAGSRRFLSEADSLALLAARGIPVVAHRVCHSAAEARAAHAAVGAGAPVVVKACSAQLPHKSEYGLVHLGRSSAEDVAASYEAIATKLGEMKVEDGSVIVAAMRRAQREFVVGARRDARFGTLVMLGDGGKYVEALPDIALLRWPFSEADVIERLHTLRIAPLYAGVRGEPPMALGALARLAVTLGALVEASPAIASADLNPVMVGAAEADTVVVDALIERNA